MADWCPRHHCDTDKTIQNREFFKCELMSSLYPSLMNKF